MIVVSIDPRFWQNVRAALQRDPRFRADEESVHSDDPLTNIYPVPVQPAEWENWRRVSGLPHLQSMAHLIVETRSAEWVAAIGALLTDATTFPVWLIDATDKVWPADQVSPDRVTLA